MLTLDETTLFYWNLRESYLKKRKHGCAIQDWAQSIPYDSKPLLKSVNPPSTSKPTTASASTSKRDEPVSSFISRAYPLVRIVPNVLNSSSYDFPRESKSQPKHSGITWKYGGPVSECDETRGVEWEALMKMPPTKAKNRALLRSKPLVVETTSNKEVKGFPQRMDKKAFHRHFIPTYIRFVSQQSDPWKIPVNKACKALQYIWNALFADIEYSINSTTLVYEEAQRAADCYRESIGSAGLTIALAFLDSQAKTRYNDKKRVAFANDMLQERCFLYKNHGISDPSDFEGFMEGIFIFQTFGHHFTAIEGSRNNIKGLDRSRHDIPKPCGGLALAAASVERALTLISTGIVTAAMVHATANGGLPSRPDPQLDRTPIFNEKKWRSATRGYAAAIEKTFEDEQEKFEEICNQAIHHAKKVCRYDEATVICREDMDTVTPPTIIARTEDDSRANLREGSEPSSDEAGDREDSKTEYGSE